MEIKAEQKYMLISPKKVIKAALASARERGLSEDSLKFKEIQIGEGPRLKRGRPVSRGQWHPYKKRMSHIKVILTTIRSEVKTEKKEGNKEVKKENKEAKEIKTKVKKIKKEEKV
jgi:large subunit ribosomal protein L22